MQISNISKLFEILRNINGDSYMYMKKCNQSWDNEKLNLIFLQGSAFVELRVNWLRHFY